MIKQKKLKIFIIFLILIAVILVIFPIRIQQTKTNGYGKEPIGLIKKDDIIEEKIFVDSNDINKIGILFSTYGVKNTKGSIEIILSSSNKIIKKQILELKNIKDNSWQYIEFKDQKGSYKKHYILTIKYNTFYNDNSLTVWKNTSNDKNNYLKINKKTQNSNLYYTIRGKTKNYDFLLYDLILIGLLMVIYSFNKEDE